ncbi:hypothetical protein K2X96_03545 [Patescibacteria group bacterium]|nr:hypothetical protein [Patescibacteria group bacterium]
MPPEILFALMLKGTFFFLLFLSTVYGVILGYHWFSYSATRSVAVATMTSYIILATLCLLLMVPAIL